MPVPSSFSNGSSSGGGTSFYGSSGGGSDFYGAPQGPEERVPQRTILSTVAKLVYSLDADQREKGRKWLEDNESQFSDQDLQQYGLKRPETDHRSLLRKVGGGLLSGVETFGNVIGRPNQVVMHGLKTIGEGIGGSIGAIAHAPGYEDVSLGDVLRTTVHNAGDTWGAATDFGGGHDINAREMLTLDKNAGGGGWAGRLIGAADTAGMLAVDPLSYVGAAGAGEATKFGLKAFQEGTEGTADALVRQGAKGLADAVPETERAIEAGRRMATEANAGKRGWIHHIIGNPEADRWYGPVTKWKQMRAAEVAERTVPGRMEALANAGTSQERLVQNSINQTLNRAKQGLKFGGETLVGKDTLLKPLRKLGLAGEMLPSPNAALIRVIAEHESAIEELAKVHSDIAELGHAPRKTVAREAKLLEQAAAAEERAVTARAAVEGMRENIARNPTLADNPAYDEFDHKPMFEDQTLGGEQEVPLTDNAVAGNAPDGEMPTHYRVTAPNGKVLEDHSLEQLKMRFRVEMNAGDAARPGRGNYGADLGKNLPEPELEQAWQDALDSGAVKAFRTNKDEAGVEAPFYHGTRHTIPVNPEHGGPQFRPPSEIDTHSNLHGPSLYTTQDQGYHEGFAGLGTGPFDGLPGATDVPTTYNVTLPGSAKDHKFFDLDAEQGLPAGVKDWMREQLEREVQAAEASGASQTDIDRFMQALQNLDDPRAIGHNLYDDFVRAHTYYHGAERAEPVIREFQDVMAEHGFAGMEYKTYGGKEGDKVRTIFDTQRANLTETPWRKTRESKLAEGFMPGARYDEEGYLPRVKAANEAQAQADKIAGKAAQTSKTRRLGELDAVTEDLAKHKTTLEEAAGSAKALREAKAARDAAAQELVDISNQERAIWDELRADVGTNGNRDMNPEERATMDALHEQKMEAFAKEKDAEDAYAAAQAAAKTPDEIREIKKNVKKYTQRKVQLEKKFQAGSEKLNARKALIEEDIKNLAAEREHLAHYPEQWDRQPIERFGGKLEGARNRIKNAFQRDPGIKEGHGARSAADFKIAEQKQVGRAQHGGQDIVRGYENLMKDARAENPAIEDEIGDRIMPAMEAEGGVPALVQQYMDEGRPAAARLVQVAHDERDRITAGRIRLGLLDPEHAHDTETWIKRQFTPEAQRYIDRYLRGQTPAHREQMASKLRMELTGGMSGEKRGIAPTAQAGSKALDDAARKHFRSINVHIPKDVPIYNTNPILATATSGVEFAGQEASVKLVKDLSELRDDRGVPLVTTNKRLAKLYGHQKVAGIGGQQVWAPPEIADALHRYDALQINDETMKSMDHLLRKVNGIWKAQATVPLIGGAFHARNAETNVMLNWIAGLENPLYYSKAAGLQRKYGKLQEQLGRAGMSMDEIIDKTDTLTAQEKHWLKGAREHNILQTNYVGHGLESGESPDTRLRARSQTRRQKARDLFNPTNQDKFLGVRTGRKVGRGIENNARLAHYIWAENKYGDAAIAAESVKKFLFDYDDLSDMEKQIKHKYIPFYTFMRKNVALMADTMLTNPGKLRRGMIVDQELKDDDAPWINAIKGQGGSLIPGYQMKANQAPRHLGPLAPLGANTILNMESPWGAAEESVRPVVETLGELPGTNRIIPDEFKNPEGTSGAARSLVNLPGGPMFEAARVALGKAYDVDTFTGGQAQREGKFDKIADILGIFAPSPGKASRLSDAWKMEGPDYKGAERTDRRKALALNLILGLNSSAVGPGSSAQERESRYYELQDWIEKQNRGLALDDPRRIPTLDELRERGISIPGSGKTGFYG